MDGDDPEDIRDLEFGIYRIGLDGDWSLSDLYRFPRLYSQVYAFFYVLETPPSVQRGFRDPFVSNPWVGGYDAVNFYNQLQAKIPKPARPTVVRIQYESPGWLDLGLLVGVALSASMVVNRVVASGERINHLYTAIQKGIQDRKLAKLDIKRKELELSRDQLRFAREAADDLGEMMNLPKRNRLRELTGDDLIMLKIVLAQFRRVRDIGKFLKSGKIHLGHAATDELPTASSEESSSGGGEG